MLTTRFFRPLTTCSESVHQWIATLGLALGPGGITDIFGSWMVTMDDEVCFEAYLDTDAPQ